MQKEVLGLFTSKGILVTGQAGQRLLNSDDPMKYAQEVLALLPEGAFFLDLETVESVLGPSPPKPKDKPVPLSPSPVSAEPPAGGVAEEEHPVDDIHSSDDTPDDIALGAENVCESMGEILNLDDVPDNTAGFLAKEIDSSLHVLFDITGMSTCSGEISGFHHYFSDRYSTLRELVRRRRGYASVMKINQIDPHALDIKLIGMVRNFSTTKKGNKILDLEDDTGVISVLLPRDTDVSRMHLINDEVVGITGKKSGSRGGIRAEEIVFPDIPIEKERKRADYPVAAAFCSDIHVGSNTFLGGQWKRFISFLRGNGNATDWAEKIRYLVVAGDIVDGIGIYPGQEEELIIPELEEQYAELARLMSYLPDHIEVIMLPGNHDAVRPAEPQPTFAESITDLFEDQGVNARFLGNPSRFTIEGLNVLAYHGRSMDDLLSAIPGLSYERPLDAMKVMLQRRHLAPIYGAKTPLAPENKDYMVIDEVPDIFVTGHVHSAGLEVYRGVMMVNSSTWQDQTSYQKMHNFNPVPAKAPVIDLQTLDYRIFDFM